jgi:hypothetical protein
MPIFTAKLHDRIAPLMHMLGSLPGYAKHYANS